MAIAVANSAVVQFTADSSTLSFPSNPTAGNMALGFVVTSGETIATGNVTDNQSGNTYTMYSYEDGSQVSTSVFYCVSINSSGTFTFTINPTGSASVAFVCAEVSGHAASPLDGQNVKAEGSSAAPTTGNIVTTTTDLIIGCVSHSAGATTITKGATYTELIENEGTTHMPINVEYKIVASGTYTADWTLNTARTCGAAAAAFKQAAASTVSVDMWWAQPSEPTRLSKETVAY